MEEKKLIVPQDIYNRIESDARVWSENQYGHDDINKDYLEGALHEAMIAQAEYVRLSQPGAVWVKADTKPEHNVGVLVFIPGEDNHITSGMWDISNEWVLLDEYRTPEEEVTHWMQLPAFPEGYTWNEIPGELVDALKKVSKEELSRREPSAAAREEDAVAFSEWAATIAFFDDGTRLWELLGEGEAINGQFRFTTKEFYQVFKQKDKR